MIGNAATSAEKAILAHRAKVNGMSRKQQMATVKCCALGGVKIEAAEKAKA